MPDYRKKPEAIGRLTPEQYRVTQRLGRGERAHGPCGGQKRNAGGCVDHG